MFGAAVVLYGSHKIVVMRLGRLGFGMESVVLKLQSVAEIFSLSPQLGLKPAIHTLVNWAIDHSERPHPPT
jgi:hypothetical protein